MSDKEYWRGYDAARLQNAATMKTLCQRAEQAEARVAKLEAEAQEHEASFALYDDACRRGTALWRAGDPEHRRMVLPDTAALVAWLLERLTALEAALDEQAVATYGPAEVAHKVAEAVKQAEARAAQAEHRLRTLWRERDEARTARAGREGGESQPLPPDPTCPECHGTGDAPNAQFRCPCRWRHLSKAGREGTGCTDNCYQCQCPDGPGREGTR